MKLQSIIQTLTGLFFVLNMNSQNMNIASGGNLTTSDGAEITVIGNLVIDPEGTFELKNATLKVEGVSSSGKIKYTKTLANSRWSGISSPVKNQNIKDFADFEPLDSGQGGHSNNKGLASYDNTKNNWKIYQYNSNDWGDFTEGEAYLIKLREITGTDDADIFYDVCFEGPILNTDVQLSTKSSDIEHNGETVPNRLQYIGNPFPSVVNIVDENGVNGEGLLKYNEGNMAEITLYFYNSSMDNFDTVNYTEAKTMNPTEGFFAKTNDVFTIPRSLTNHPQRYSNNKSRTNTKESIFLRITDNATGGYRQTSIFYMEGATTGNDPGYDSTFFYNGVNYFGIYTHLLNDSIGDDYAIQTLPKNGYEKMIVPVGINAKNSGDLSSTEITISAEAMNMPSEINVYIEDKEMNTIVLLDENSTYTTMISTGYKGIGRFYLHTSSTTLDVNEALMNINNISVYNSSRENLRIVGLQNGQATLRIFNILGKKILDTRFKGNGVNDIKLPQSITSGVYIVQLITSTGKLNKKISIE